jgi:cytochrome c-type biogenesis protein
MDVNIWVAFVAGLISFATPCILPLFPSYLSYITGISIEDLSEENQGKQFRLRTILHALLFVLGFSIIFISMGAAATTTGKFLVHNRDILTKVGGILIILIGLFILGTIRPFFLMREWRLPVTKRGFSGFPMSLLAGMGFGTGWSPCIGPLLGTILVIAADADTISSGIQLLSFYSIGLGLPFIIGAIGLGWTLDLFKRLRPYLKTIKIVSGIITILVGILIFSGYYQKLTQYLISNL